MQLLWVALENQVHRTRLGLRETARLGGQPWYWRLRAALARQSLWGPAYQVARWEGGPTGIPAADLTYGETPILTAWEMLTELGPDSRRVVDLGCGRGVIVLTAAAALGWPGVGVEALPGLVRRARGAARSLRLDCRFEVADFREIELPEGDLYFVSPTTLEDESFQRLCEAMENAPSGALAYSLSVPMPGWELLEKRRRAYSWGWATTYLQRQPRRDCRATGAE